MHDGEKAARLGIERTPGKKRKKLDRLTRDVLAAEAAGMSYGKWKALHPHTPDEDEEEEQEMDPDSVVVNCEYCGERFVKSKNNQTRKFCSANCQKNYNNKKRREKARQEAIGQPAVCPICGVDFMADYQHRIYCSTECFTEGQRRRAKELYISKKETQSTPKKVETDLDGVTLTCEQCGVQFVNLKNRKRRFCSTACKNVSYNNERAAKRRQEAAGRTATCAVCGKTFTPDNGNCIYCSPGCHAVGKNRNNREWYARNKEKKEAAENGSI